MNVGVRVAGVKVGTVVTRVAGPCSVPVVDDPDEGA